jgi:TetR/AcrR family transcriptional regulator
MTGGTTESQKARIRKKNLRRILDAAEVVFAKSGFSGAGMAEIAHVAGLPKANLYYYFGTKEELYRVLLADLVSDWQNMMEILAADLDAQEAICTFVRARLEYARTRPCGWKIFVGEVLQESPFMVQLFGQSSRELIDRVVSVIERWNREGHICVADGRYFLFNLWAITRHYTGFEFQACALLGKTRITDADWAGIISHVQAFALRAAGLGD